MQSCTPAIPAPPSLVAQPSTPRSMRARDLYAVSPVLDPSGHHFTEPGFLGQTTSAWAKSPVDLASTIALEEEEDVVIEQARVTEAKLAEAKPAEVKPGFRFRVGRKTRRRSTRRAKIAPAKEGEGGKQAGKVSAWTFLCFKTSRRTKAKEDGRTWSSIIDPADFQVYAMALAQEQEHALGHLPAPSPLSPPPMAYSPLRTSSTGSTQASVLAARDESLRRLEGTKAAISSWMDPDESETWGIHAW
ncbi:hypothetical protein BC937DRAFT_87910 [Endogone sp. FLAS-F59071]|nr:hypothetical protein BC937DRAFT_87910 [Endogone sp. FLAS-F59071]|eukprot:RUS12439.1 hypothetical protein BC937DRAFT_87910 [Endogone sp. FLAS-F59071]